MSAESAALLGSSITSATGLLGMIIAKTKWVYRRTDQGCQPACACMDGKLEKDNDELEVYTVSTNGLDLLYVAKKE